ncbi:helix-turn-helix domain-containing protein [Limosilactobacillus viscerum]|uniref:helix-turn-helix domain-containing protein n=1 Tax=Limosilactobacillus viscerum TaxID=2993450 RepID=UPI0024BA048D|nr:helix-turn-helix transcriptional regulator [Limosilactobacillus viscerum]
MDIQKFVQRRKQKGISQVKLCDGICTQSTLSKLENKGQVPSVRILNQLCQRLDMTISDLSKSERPAKQVRLTVLDRVEQQLMAEQFPAAIKLLATVNVDDLISKKMRMQYYYLKGMIDTLTSNQTATTMFNFTQILDKLDEEHQTVFSKLAYLGCGILYARRDHLGNAEFFFTKVINYLDRARARAKSTITLADIQYGRIIMMRYYVAEYQALRKRLADSDASLGEVKKLCAARYLTLFMPRVKLLEANNAISSGEPSEKISQLLSEALVFARFNKNSVVELQAAALKKQFSELA